MSHDDQHIDGCENAKVRRRTYPSVWWTAVLQSLLLALVFAITGFSRTAVLEAAGIAFVATLVGYVSMRFAATPGMVASGGLLHWAATFGAIIGTFSAFVFCFVIEVYPIFLIIGTLVGVVLAVVDAAIWRDAGAIGHSRYTIGAPFALVALLLICVYLSVILMSGSSEKSSLINVIDRGDRNAVLRLLSAGENANVLTSFGDTVLIRAVGRQDIDNVRILCVRGADVNARSKDDFTPLCYAAFAGRPDIAEVLLSRGADINARDKVR